ncbi:MAG: IPT/TIG domain-containing protein, partial [Bacteroidota bacterium]
MKNLLKILSLICLTAIFLVKCNDAEIAPKAYPILTMEQVETDENGATFSAEIINLGQQAVISYGFEWKQIASSENWTVKALTEPANVGKYSTVVDTDLLRDVEYVVRPFITTNTYTVYGTQIEFISEGSTQPQILEYSPKEVFDGTVVQLKGSNLTSRLDRITVFVERIQAEVIKTSEDSVEFIVPASDFVGNAELKIEVGDQTIVLEDAFKVLGPEISAFSTNTGHSGDIMDITGQNLTQNGTTEVYFGGFKADILEMNTEKITVIVPVTNSFFDNYTGTISVKSGLKVEESSTLFTIESSWSSKKETPFHWPWLYGGFSNNNRGYIFEISEKTLFEYNPFSNSWTSLSSPLPGERDENSLF